VLNRFVAAGLGLVLATPSAGRAKAEPLPDGLSAPEPAIHATAIHGDTLKLGDGREARLVGIEAPKPGFAPDRKTGDAALNAWAEESRLALQAAIGTGGVICRYDALRRDRYGRLLVQATRDDGAWLQALQIAAGEARVHGDGANRLGLRALLGIEAAARGAKRGIWRHAAFAVKDAADPELGRFIDSFQIIEGRVVSAEIVKDTGYVNFGRDWKTDLTLVVKKAVLALGDPVMVDLPRLAGRSIRCRGWLDLHDGPTIDITHPEQIEVLEE
jgi:endonuclease YncB( thermonuclease family)